MMTYCHFRTRRSRKNVKNGGMGNFGAQNSNMAFVFEIDALLINGLTVCHQPLIFNVDDINILIV